MGEGDLRSRRRSNVQVANVGVERPTFPPLPYQGTLARCYLAVTSGPYYRLKRKPLLAMMISVTGHVFMGTSMYVLKSDSAMPA